MLPADSSPTNSSPLASSASEQPLPSLWAVTWPLFLSLALSLSLHFTDAFFLSRISDSAAAAAGALNPLLGATVVLFSATGQAGASVAGRLLGARRHRELPLTYLALFGFNLIVGLGVSALLFTFHRVAPSWLGLTGETHAAAQTYMAVLGGTQVLQAVQLAYSNILNSRGATRLALVGAVANNVTNIGLNLMLLHGTFGLGPSVGRVAGATVLALFTGLLLNAAVVHFHLRIRFPWRTRWTELRGALGPILRIGLPSASEPICYQLGQIVIGMLVISLGAQALAARTYVLSFVMITSVLWSFALGVGTQIAIAHRIGAGKLDEAHAVLHRALSLAVAGSGGIALLLALFHAPLLGLFTSDAEIIRLAAPLFALGVAAEMGRAVNIVAGGALRSSGDAMYVAVVGSALMWLVGVGSAYTFGGALGLGLTGVWLALVADETLRGVVNYRRWRSGRWRIKSVLAPAHAESPASVRSAVA
jgi:putative MATE family efflux protein